MQSERCHPTGRWNGTAGTFARYSNAGGRPLSVDGGPKDTSTRSEVGNHLSDDTRSLDPTEQARLDSILAAARNVHYTNLVLAGTAILTSLAGADVVKVPLLELALPTTKSVIILYLLSILLTAADDRLFHQAHRWMSLDPRRPSFPWHALGYDRVNYFTVTSWIFLPVVITAIAASIALGRELAGSSLLLPGFLLAGTQRLMDRYGPLIRDRRDHRGGAATFSMWLLYVYRLIRNALLWLVFTTVVLAAIPDARQPMLTVSKVITVALLAMIALRTAAGGVYRRIDQLGSRWGFPATNEHDYRA